MGSVDSVEPQDVVGKVEESDAALPPISVQYGPNIVSKLLGYDQRTEDLSQAAHQLYDAISRPSNRNKKKAQTLISDVHTKGIEHGRATVSLSEIEREMMDDIEYKTFLHKKTYGIRNIDEVDKKYNLSNMDSVCEDFKSKLEQCVTQNKNDSSDSIPYRHQMFASLNCSQQIDLYNSCVQSALY